MQNNLSTKHCNPIKYIRNKSTLRKLKKKIFNICDEIYETDFTNYEVIRKLAQIFHHFAPGIGHNCEVTGENFYIANIGEYDLLPTIYKIISEDTYVEIGISIAVLCPFSSKVRKGYDYTFIFRDNNNIDIRVVHKFDGTNTLMGIYSCKNKAFATSTEHLLFRYAFIDTLCIFIKSKLI